MNSLKSWCEIAVLHENMLKSTLQQAEFAANLSQEMERVLKDWFWKDGVAEANALNVWQQSCQQPCCHV